MRRSEFMLGGVNIEGIKTCQAMENKVRFCQPSTLWGNIVTTLVEGGYSSLPVVDSQNNLIGIVTEYDLLKVILEERDVNKVKAKDIMTHNPTTVNEDTSFREVVKILENNHLIRVPVVKNNKLVGIVTRRDLLFCYHQASAEPEHLI